MEKTASSVLWCQDCGKQFWALQVKFSLGCPLKHRVLTTVPSGGPHDRWAHQIIHVFPPSVVSSFGVFLDRPLLLPHAKISQTIFISNTLNHTQWRLEALCTIRKKTKRSIQSKHEATVATKYSPVGRHVRKTPTLEDGHLL